MKYEGIDKLKSKPENRKSNATKKKVVLKLIRKEEEMLQKITELLKSDNLEISKSDANLALGCIKAELAIYKRLKDEGVKCKSNLRKSVYLLSIGGYMILGYSSLKECLEDKFPKNINLSTLYREAEAARLEVLLNPKNGTGVIRESVLRPLSKLKDDKKTKQAWREAMKNKDTDSEYPTGEVVKAEVNFILEIETADKPKLKWDDDSAEKIAVSIGKSLINNLSKFEGEKLDIRLDEILDALEDYVTSELKAKKSK